MANRGRKSASRKSSWTKTVKRDTVKGGRGRDRRSRSPASPALYGRLRRLEFCMLHLLGATEAQFDVDKFIRSVLELEKDAKTEQSRYSDEGSAIPLPHQGTPVREAARAPGADWGPEGGEDALFDENPTPAQTEE